MKNERERFALGVGITITAIWVISFILDAVLPHYQAPPELSALMIGVAGFAFGDYVWGRSKNDKNNDDKPPFGE